MKKILTVNRASFCLIGLLSGLTIAFVEPYRYSENNGIWNYLMLLIPGILYGLPILYYIAIYSTQKNYSEYLKSLLLIILAFPIAVYIVTLLGARVALLPFLLVPIFFISGAAGSMLIGYALSRYSSLQLKNYVRLGLIGGLTAVPLLLLALPAWGDSSPDAIFWLYPVWLAIVSSCIGRLLESSFAGSADKRHNF